MNKLVSTINNQAITDFEAMPFNPSWALIITGKGSRYWLHVSGKLVPIVEK